MESKILNYEKDRAEYLSLQQEVDKLKRAVADTEVKINEATKKRSLYDSNDSALVQEYYDEKLEKEKVPVRNKCEEKLRELNEKIQEKKLELQTLDANLYNDKLTDRINSFNQFTSPYQQDKEKVKKVIAWVGQETVDEDYRSGTCFDTDMDDEQMKKSVQIGFLTNRFGLQELIDLMFLDLFRRMKNGGIIKKLLFALVIFLEGFIVLNFLKSIPSIFPKKSSLSYIPAPSTSMLNELSTVFTIIGLVIVALFIINAISSTAKAKSLYSKHKKYYLTLLDPQKAAIISHNKIIDGELGAERSVYENDIAELLDEHAVLASFLEDDNIEGICSRLQIEEIPRERIREELLSYLDENYTAIGEKIKQEEQKLYDLKRKIESYSDIFAKHDKALDEDYKDLNSIETNELKNEGTLTNIFSVGFNRSSSYPREIQIVKHDYKPILVVHGYSSPSSREEYNKKFVGLVKSILSSVYADNYPGIVNAIVVDLDYGRSNEDQLPGNIQIVESSQHLEEMVKTLNKQREAILDSKLKDIGKVNKQRLKDENSPYKYNLVFFRDAYFDQLSYSDVKLLLNTGDVWGFIPILFMAESHLEKAYGSSQDYLDIFKKRYTLRELTNVTSKMK